MNDNNGEQLFPAYTTKSTGGRRVLFVIAMIILLIGGILGGLFFLGASARNSREDFVVPTIAVPVTPLPTSSASAVLQAGLTGAVSPSVGLAATVDSVSKLDRSELGVAVLNGSGVAGAAGGVSDYLGGLGYRIVRVENADGFTYTNLNVIVKKNKSRYADLLRRDLRAKAEFASVSASVSDEIGSEAVVIVGK